MDEHLILEFATETEANQALVIINQIAAAWWVSQGYTVINGQLIGKNAATGEDMPESASTTSWDIPRKSPNNTWYIASPTSDPRFYAWREYLPQGVVFPDDKIMPDSWTPVRDE